MIDLSNLPLQITLKNTSTEDQKLSVEGRSLILPKGESVKVKADTPGQVLAYYGQESSGLRVTDEFYKDYTIVYVKQTINQDGTCNLYLSTEGAGQRYVCNQLDSGEIVLTSIGG